MPRSITIVVAEDDHEDQDLFKEAWEE